MKQGAIIAVNTVARYGVGMISMIAGVFASRWALRVLGEANYGAFASIAALIAFVGAVNVAMSIAVSRYFAHAVGAASVDADAANGLRKCREWFNTAFFIHAILASCSIAVGYPVCSWYLDYCMNLFPEQIEGCIWTLRFLSVACFLEMINIPFYSMLVAKQKVAEVAAYSLITVLVYTAGLGCMVKFEEGSLTLFAALACVSTVAARIAITLAALRFKECRFSLRMMWSPTRIKELVIFAGLQLVGHLGNIAKIQGVLLLVNRLLGPLLCVPLNIASTVSAHADALAAAMCEAFSPAVMNKSGERDRSSMMRLSICTCKFGVIAGLFFIIPLVLEMDWVLKCWLECPPKYSALACRLALAAIVMAECVRGAEIAMNAEGHILRFQSINGIASAAMLVGIYIIAYKFEMGFVPVVIMVASFRLMISALTVVVAGMEKCFPAGDWFKQVFLRLMASIVVPVGIGLTVQSFFKEESLTRAATVSIVAMLTFAGVALFVLMNRDERSAVIAIVSSAIRRRR